MKRDDAARYSEMPAYRELLSEEQIRQLTHYVLSLSDQQHDAALLAAGGELFEQECVACHGEGGKGDRELGAPNLTDFITLYGNSPEEIAETDSPQSERRNAELVRPAHRVPDQASIRLCASARRRRVAA